MTRSRRWNFASILAESKPTRFTATRLAKISHLISFSRRPPGSTAADGARSTASPFRHCAIHTAIRKSGTSSLRAITRANFPTPSKARRSPARRIALSAMRSQSPVLPVCRSRDTWLRHRMSRRSAQTRRQRMTSTRSGTLNRRMKSVSM